MKIYLAGVRGSTPMADAGFLKYGGETTCLWVEGVEGDTIVLDAGTGIRKLAEPLAARSERDVLLILTHYHLDHTVGLPSLPLVYEDGWIFDIASQAADGVRGEDVIRALFDKPAWPIHLDALAAEFNFVDLGHASIAQPLVRGTLEIRWCSVRHAPESIAVRLDDAESGKSMVFATDIEWQASSADEQASFLELCVNPKKADVLFFDAHYTPDEYPQFKGWGHSTWQDAVDVATKAGIEDLRLIHHAPSHDDKKLAEIEKDVQKKMPGAKLAREGEVLQL